MGDSSFNWLASVGVWFLGFISKGFIDWWKDKRQKFRGEYLIKAELERIKHNLFLEINGRHRADKIDIIYGADYVRNNHLFGEFMTQVLYQYERLSNYNSLIQKFAEHIFIEGAPTRVEIIRSFSKDRDGTLRRIRYIEEARHSTAMDLNKFLKSPWLKKTPDDYSDLSIIKFLRYLLGRDAFEETVKIDWWKIWKITSKGKIL